MNNKTNDDKTTLFRTQTFIVVATFCIVAIVFSVLFINSRYIQNLKKDHLEKTIDTISIIHSRSALHINEGLDWITANVGICANKLNKDANLFSEDNMKIVKTFSNDYDFTEIAIVDSNGNFQGASGLKTNVADKEFFINTFQTKQPITIYTKTELFNTKCIIFTFPLFNKNHLQVGILVAYISKDFFEKRFLYQPEISEGLDNTIEYSFILDYNTGEFIVKPSNFLSEENLHHFSTTIQKAIISNSPNKILFKENVKSRDLYAIYTKLKATNLCAVTFLSKSEEGKHNLIANRTITVIFVLLALILILFLATFSYIQISNIKKLQKFTMKDRITNGGNGDWFNIEAQKLINISTPNSRALIFLDIDKFKVINDKYGYEAGNKTLRYIYNCIVSSLESGEIAARVEADTFAILVKYYSENVLKERIDLLSLKINSFNIPQKERFLFYISCGIYIINKNDSNILSMRDKAFFALNNSSKITLRTAHIGFFSENEHNLLLKEKEIENKMEFALLDNQFIVYLQPKYNVQNDTIVGAEALVRWNDPKLGLILPNQFIPLFEKNGFIQTLDLYVFRQVCKIIRKWLDEGKQPVTISVNLSRVYLNNTDFLNDFEKVIDYYKVPAKYIELEITESIMQKNLNDVINIINRIHEKGFSCSLDDFGSGYSSLNMLKNIPIDVLKIDRKFFTDNEDNPERGNSIIGSIIDLAHKLNIKTVSEGVENNEQLEFLKKTNCDMVQCFLKSKPMPVEEFEKILFD
ncbi:MAG: bifunctional diguanylate cyclase/phosphodiesterase [Treponema sp.]|nr:bifunctional diguanylate cyclase/phosphodiesterase [Treponema sp.]